MSSAFKNLVVARKELNVRYQDLFVLLGFENFLPVESTSAGPTVASYINSFTDNKSLWQRIKALNLEIPLLNAQGGREPGKFVSGLSWFRKDENFNHQISRIGSSFIPKTFKHLTRCHTPA